MPAPTASGSDSTGGSEDDQREISPFSERARSALRGESAEVTRLMQQMKKLLAVHELSQTIDESQAQAVLEAITREREEQQQPHTTHPTNQTLAHGHLPLSTPAAVASPFLPVSPPASASSHAPPPAHRHTNTEQEWNLDLLDGALTQVLEHRQQQLLALQNEFQLENHHQTQSPLSVSQSENDRILHSHDARSDTHDDTYTMSQPSIEYNGSTRIDAPNYSTIVGDAFSIVTPQMLHAPSMMRQSNSRTSTPSSIARNRTTHTNQHTEDDGKINPNHLPSSSTSSPARVRRQGEGVHTSSFASPSRLQPPTSTSSYSSPSSVLIKADPSYASPSKLIDGRVLVSPSAVTTAPPSASSTHTVSHTSHTSLWNDSLDSKQPTPARHEQISFGGDDLTHAWSEVHLDSTIRSNHHRRDVIVSQEVTKLREELHMMQTEKSLLEQRIISLTEMFVAQAQLGEEENGNMCDDEDRAILPPPFTLPSSASISASSPPIDSPSSALLESTLTRLTDSETALDLAYTSLTTLRESLMSKELEIEQLLEREQVMKQQQSEQHHMELESLRKEAQQAISTKEFELLQLQHETREELRRCEEAWKTRSQEGRQEWMKRLEELTKLEQCRRRELRKLQKKYKNLEEELRAKEVGHQFQVDKILEEHRSEMEHLEIEDEVKRMKLFNELKELRLKNENLTFEHQQGLKELEKNLEHDFQKRQTESNTTSYEEGRSEVRKEMDEVVSKKTFEFESLQVHLHTIETSLNERIEILTSKMEEEYQHGYDMGYEQCEKERNVEIQQLGLQLDAVRIVLTRKEFRKEDIKDLIAMLDEGRRSSSNTPTNDGTTHGEDGDAPTASPVDTTADGELPVEEGYARGFEAGCQMSDDEIEMLNRRLKEIIQELEQANKERHDLRQQTERQKEEMDQVSQRLDELSTALLAADSRIESLTLELSQQKSGHASSLSSLDSSHSAELEVVESTLSLLRSSYAVALSELSSLRSSHAERELDWSKREMEWKIQSQQYEQSLELKEQELKQARREKEEANTQAKTNNNVTTKDLLLLQQHIEQLENELNKTAIHLRCKDLECVTLTRQLSSLRDELNDPESVRILVGGSSGRWWNCGADWSVMEMMFGIQLLALAVLAAVQGPEILESLQHQTQG